MVQGKPVADPVRMIRVTEVTRQDDRFSREISYTLKEVKTVIES